LHLSFNKTIIITIEQVFSQNFGAEDFSPVYDKPVTGVYYGGLKAGGRQLAVQIAGVVFSAAWSFVFTWLLAMIIDKTIGLRVSDDHEEQGLDMSIHGEKLPYYNEPMAKEGSNNSLSSSQRRASLSVVSIPVLPEA
jgi:ammonia channel protein AmtB